MEAPEYIYGGFRGQFGAEGKGKAGGDHFIVEDLLDFSNEEEYDAGVGDAAVESAAGNSTDSSTVTAVDSCSFSGGGGDQHFSGELVCRSLADPCLSGDLCEPYDELAELEWLSNFVEESFSSEDLQKLQLISGIKSSTSSETRGTDGEISVAGGGRGGAHSHSPSPFLPEGPVPAKARSKRSRAAPNSWSSRLLVLSPSSATSSSDSDPLSSPAFLSSAVTVKKAPSKPSKKKDPSTGGVFAPSDGRKCLHCQTDKTPQWRTGPMGPKTLCNACGVRYKSGRLVPEYRPAASPTFVLSKHSNSHRKVLELRRQKEIQQQHGHHHQPFIHPSAAVYGGDSPVGDDFLIHHHIGPDFRQLI